MNDRAAFAHLDATHHADELRRELQVVTDERDTAVAECNRLNAQIDSLCRREALLTGRNGVNITV